MRGEERRRSKPGPALPATAFNESLVRLNRLDALGFEEWLFHPGMLFAARGEWWGSVGARPRPHEGLDLCLFRDVKGHRRYLEAGAQVPVMYDGEVAAIRSDFLGRSIFVYHEIRDAEHRRLFSVYGHTVPCEGITEGEALKEGNVIATIARVGPRAGRAVPHLHISLVWLPDSVGPDAMDWGMMRNPEIASLIDPLEVISCRYAVLPNGG